MLARTRRSAGSLPAAISARAASGPTAANHSSAIHSGCECRSAASAGVRSGSAAIRARLGAGPPQDGVHQAGAARRVRLGERHRLADRGMGGDAIEERELVHAEAQRGQHRRLEPARRAPGERGDHVVERRAPLHCPVRESGRERPVA